MIMRDFEGHCILVEFIGSRHTTLMLRIQLYMYIYKYCLKFALQKVKCHAFSYVVGPTLITGAASSVTVSTKVQHYPSKLTA